MKSFFELISKRESCRNYSDQKVEKALKPHASHLLPVTHNLGTLSQ